MDKPDRFETPRLVGVPLSARDAEGFCRMKADPVGTAAYFALPLLKDAALQKLTPADGRPPRGRGVYLRALS